MRLLPALALVVSAFSLLGCATQQNLDDQAQSVTQQLGGLAGAQKNLEARLGKLESDMALLAGRLNQGDPASAALQRELDALRTQAASMQQALSALTGKVDAQAGGIAQAQSTADDAIKIARDSRLVSGKIVDTLQLNDDMVLYNYEAPELTPAGRAALDRLIASTRPKLPHVFIEIIGFSDNTSLNSQNNRIALERAESVRRYLHEVGDIPLHRMSAISYGDLKPVSNDPGFESRRQNRRVVVQVLNKCPRIPPARRVSSQQAGQAGGLIFGCFLRGCSSVPCAST
ncbi:MAG: OmpA family protein [Thiobacillus sp.]